MKGRPTCPRCGAEVHPPGLWSNAWTCNEHGAVLPLQPVSHPGPEALEYLRTQAKVPIWLLWPPPAGWMITGLAHAGDDRSGARATVVACSGPAPLGGVGDVMVIAEEPGLGLGARFAGLPGPDPGAGFDAGPAPIKMVVDDHLTPFWNVDGGPQAAVFVGEAKGLWLWLILWPADAGLLLLEHMSIIDLRRRRHDVEVAYGALTPRLSMLPRAG